MHWVLRSSLRFGRLVLAAAVAVTLLAVVQVRHARVDTYPEFTPPAVQIQTEALGLSAAEVEQMITVPLEQDLLNGVPWLDHISSTSMPGLSAIDLVFEAGTDLYAARQMVQERLTQAHALPNVGSAPVMVQPLASSSRIAMIGLTSSDVSLVEMSVLARWKVRPRLMGIPGVANVSIYGQRDRQLQVQVDPARLRAHHVTLTQVIETAGNALWVSPLSFVEASTPGTGGFVESANQRLAIQHVLPITTPTQLEQVPVEGTSGRTLRLGDVTTVVEDHQPLIGDALVDGSPSLYLVVDRFPGSDTLQVTRDVEAAMAEMAPGLSGITIDTSVYRPASFIESSLRTIGVTGLIGLSLLVGVFLLFLWSWRAALVGLSAVVVSLATAVYVLYLRGTTLTLMTLLGLSLALLLVVDEAVRDVDTALRHLRADRRSGEPRPTSDVVIESFRESRGALAYATLVALVAAVPFLVLETLATSFTRPLAVTYATALAMSTVVALTVAPVLAALLLGRNGGDLGPGPVARWLQRRHDRLAAGRVAGAGTAWVLVAVLAVAALTALPQLGSGDPLPTLHDRDLLVKVTAAPGTSLTEMDRVTARMGRELRAVSGVQAVGTHVGRAVTSDVQVDVSSAELWVAMDPQADYDRTRAAVSSVVHGYPGVGAALVTYDQDRLGAAASAASGDLVVRVYGQDLPALRAKAQEIRQQISTVDGVDSASVEPLVQQPTAHIQVDLAAAERYGLRPGDVRRDATTVTSGLTVGNLYEQAKVFDVVVRGVPSTRQSLTSLQDMLIDTPSGRPVPLGQVASVTVGAEPTAIRHNEVSRSVDVIASIRGRDAAAVAADVRTKVEGLAMPTEAHVQVLSNAATRQSAVRRGLLYGLGALVIVYLLLQAAVTSWRRAAVLLAGAALAGAGGVVVAPLVGGVEAAGALAGVVAVGLLAVHHGLFLARRTAVYEDAGAASRDAARAAAREQVPPVVQTAAAAVALVAPMAVLGGSAGLEILRPFAVTVLGGLVTLLAVSLLVLPALLPVLAPSRRARVLDLTTDSTRATVVEGMGR